MTAYILGAATLILLVLILWRRSSSEFRRRSEEPKFQFLANLRLGSRAPAEPEPSSEKDRNQSTKGNNEEEHKP